MEGVGQRILTMLMNEAADAVFGKWLRQKRSTRRCKRA